MQLYIMHGHTIIYFAFEGFLFFLLLIKMSEWLPGGKYVHLSPREQSDDASGQICGEWAIYDGRVTPNSSKPTTPQVKTHAFTTSIQVCGISDDYSGPFWRSRKQRLKLSSPPNVFFYGKSLLGNSKGFCVNWVA